MEYPFGNGFLLGIKVFFFILGFCMSFAFLVYCWFLGFTSTLKVIQLIKKKLRRQ